MLNWDYDISHYIAHIQESEKQKAPDELIKGAMERWDAFDIDLRKLTREFMYDLDNLAKEFGFKNSFDYELRKKINQAKAEFLSLLLESEFKKIGQDQQ